MVGTVTAALRHIPADLATLLDAPMLSALCRAVGYRWRARLLDPGTTIPLCLRHIVSGHTAWRHLPHCVGQRLAAAALCQAHTRFPRGVWQRLRRRTAAVCERTTPLKTCPTLRPRWCPVDSSLSHAGVLPSSACKPSAWASMLLRLSC